MVELVKRLRELQTITEHCSEQSCDECENRELCDKHDNKTLSGTYKEAADAIEDLQKKYDGAVSDNKSLCRQIAELAKERNEAYGKGLLEGVIAIAQRAEDEKWMPKWIPVTERLPECEIGAEIGNVEWIICGMVFAGCFGRGGKYRDVYFRTWTDATEGVDARDVEYWRLVSLPEPPKGEENADASDKKEMV